MAITIHHEITLPAAPARIYETLVEPARFAEATGAPATGDASGFSAFGGHVLTRHVELVPGKRIVQAWRAKTWPEGVWSIARFELAGKDGGTKLVFDHENFPEDMKDHLDKGWHANYWDKLRGLA